MDALGVDVLALVYGYALGATQALLWGCLFNRRVMRIVAVCGGARTSEAAKVMPDTYSALAC